MTDKRLIKLLQLKISGKEMDSLFHSLGFEKRQGKGSHVMWFKKGFEPIVLARHGKEFKKGYLRQVIKVLKNGGIIDG